MAGQFGLTYELYQSKQSLFFRWPRISGNYRGRGMNMERFQLGSGRNARIYTRISLALNGSPDNWLEITPRSWSTSARNALPFKKNRLEPVSMNDESFDHKLEVRSQPEDFARNVLASSGLKSALLDLRGQARDMKVTIQADALSYQEQTTIKDAGYLGGVLDVLGELAVYVERYCR